jgi:hypothetical protein
MSRRRFAVTSVTNDKGLITPTPVQRHQEDETGQGGDSYGPGTDKNLHAGTNLMKSFYDRNLQFGQIS